MLRAPGVDRHTHTVNLPERQSEAPATTMEVDSSPLRPLRALETPEACIRLQRRSPATQANEGKEKREDRLTATQKFLHTARFAYGEGDTQKKNLLISQYKLAI
jgi:hypothetical protein